MDDNNIIATLSRSEVLKLLAISADNFRALAHNGWLQIKPVGKSIEVPKADVDDVKEQFVSREELKESGLTPAGQPIVGTQLYSRAFELNMVGFNDAAEVLGVSKVTLGLWMEDGHVSFPKGKVRWSVLIRFGEQQDLSPATTLVERLEAIAERNSKPLSKWDALESLPNGTPS